MLTASSILQQKGHFVLTAPPSTTVYHAIDQMVSHNVGSILVVEEERVVGIFTERDYLRRIALQGKTSKTTTLNEVMTADIICISPQYTVKECLNIMTENKCRHLPVLKNHQLIGLVSIGDCVKQLSQAAQQQVRHLTHYITGQYPG